MRKVSKDRFSSRYWPALTHLTVLNKTFNETLDLTCIHDCQDLIRMQMQTVENWSSKYFTLWVSELSLWFQSSNFELWPEAGDDDDHRKGRAANSNRHRNWEEKVRQSVQIRNFVIFMLDSAMSFGHLKKMVNLEAMFGSLAELDIIVLTQPLLWENI